MILIDPPLIFSPLSDWTSFRKEMEALAADHPDNEDVKEALADAKANEARLKKA